MSSIFNKYWKQYDLWYDRHKFAYLSELAALKKLLPKTGEGLEIGVGTGRFASALGIGSGVDPSEKMLKLARSRGIKVRRRAGEDLPFPDGTFNYVAIIITLCFVQSPYKVMMQARRVLKHNGRIIIGMIDKHSFLGKAYRKKNSVFYPAAKFLSVKEVKGLLKKAGFKKFRCYQAVFKTPADIQMVEKPQKGYGRGAFVAVGAQR